MARMGAELTKEEVAKEFTHSEEFVSICKLFGVMSYEVYVNIHE